jgi:hypothetical protein
MKVEIRQIKDGLLRITCPDERWYVKDETTFVPSNTWVCSYYPKGKGYEQWLKNNGDEAENLKKEAGNKGSKVHQAIEDLLNGVEVKLDAKYMNNDLGREEELTVEEYGILMTFVAWWKDLTANSTVNVRFSRGE